MIGNNNTDTSPQVHFSHRMYVFYRCLHIRSFWICSTCCISSQQYTLSSCALVTDLFYLWCLFSGSVHQILDSHLHYVQGVAWDPLDQFVASLSSDRSCKIYVKKSQTKAKGPDKLSFLCHHTIAKADQLNFDDIKVKAISWEL